MATTLTYISTTVTLPDDLSWPDEFTWSAAEARREYTVTGALLIETGTRQAGRPITLAGNEGRAWMARSLLETLYGWAQLPAATFTLALRGTSHSVRFDHSAGAIEAEPVFDEALPQAGDYYFATLRFIKI